MRRKFEYRNPKFEGNWKKIRIANTENKAEKEGTGGK